MYACTYAMVHGECRMMNMSINDQTLIINACYILHNEDKYLLSVYSIFSLHPERSFGFRYLRWRTRCLGHVRKKRPLSRRADSVLVHINESILQVFERFVFSTAKPVHLLVRVVPRVVYPWTSPYGDYVETLLCLLPGCL